MVKEAQRAKIDVQKATLAKACAEVLDGFRAKTISKEELCHHDAEFIAEVEAIKWAEAGEDSDGEEELPEIVVVKWKVIVVEEDNMEEDKLKEELKQPSSLVW